jgi:hypothetical protein
MIFDCGGVRIDSHMPDIRPPLVWSKSDALRRRAYGEVRA